MAEEETVIEQDPEKTPRQRAEELLKHISHDKIINEIFGDAFERQYLIYGKAPRAWRDYFKVPIPENPDTGQCKAIAAKLGALVQEATFFLAAAEAQLDALSSGEEKEYSTAFNRLIAEYKQAGKSLPAAKTLETVAQSKIMDIRGAIGAAKIIKNFWKRIIEGLIEVRKCLEQATWNNSTQTKQENYGGGGAVINRGSYGNKDPAALELQESQSDDWDV